MLKRYRRTLALPWSEDSCREIGERVRTPGKGLESKVLVSGWLRHAHDASLLHQKNREHLASVRNRAILWVLWDTGLLVSEVCALNLEDVDLVQGTLHVRGSGPRERVLPLTPEVQQALTVYLEQYRLRTGKRGMSMPDPLFLSEQRTRLTRNEFSQLFHRLCARAGLEDRRLTPTMLREMFAIRFLQTGGPPQALRRLLGLAACTPITRYLDAAGCFRRQRETAENQQKA